MVHEDAGPISEQKSCDCDPHASKYNYTSSNPNQPRIGNFASRMAWPRQMPMTSIHGKLRATCDFSICILPLSSDNPADIPSRKFGEVRFNQAITIRQHTQPAHPILTSTTELGGSSEDDPARRVNWSRK